jgi:cysteine synthase A
MLYDDITQTVGRTPVVRINRLAPSHVKMFVKLEAANPGGSVKDRLAVGIIDDAERRSVLKAGQTVVEATSGNTGIALALVCAARGYPFVAIMPESFSVERRPLMRAFGAKVILTPAADRASGAVRLAAELAEERGWFLARQFDNEANPAYHRQTTGPEILSDFAGGRLDYWVTGWGTGGTLTGAGQVLRCARPDIKIVACEPAGARLLDGQPWKPHKIQGWTPDFMPSVLDRDVCDEVVAVADDKDRDGAISRLEGIFCGISSGGTFAAALDVAARARSSSRCCRTPANATVDGAIRRRGNGLRLRLSTIPRSLPRCLPRVRPTLGLGGNDSEQRQSHNLKAQSVWNSPAGATTTSAARSPMRSSTRSSGCSHGPVKNSRSRHRDRLGFARPRAPIPVKVTVPTSPSRCANTPRRRARESSSTSTTSTPMPRTSRSPTPASTAWSRPSV